MSGGMITIKGHNGFAFYKRTGAEILSLKMIRPEHKKGPACAGPRLVVSDPATEGQN